MTSPQPLTWLKQMKDTNSCLTNSTLQSYQVSTEYQATQQHFIANFMSFIVKTLTLQELSQFDLVLNAPS